MATEALVQAFLVGRDQYLVDTLAYQGFLDQTANQLRFQSVPAGSQVWADWLTVDAAGGVTIPSLTFGGPVPWTSITGTPTTLAGYGITDALDGSGTPDTLPKWSAAQTLTDSVLLEDTGNLGVGVSPTSRLTLPAGSTTANTAPLQFTSGALETSARAGVVEFLTDAWYGTITTGAARKQFLLNEGTAFTVGSVPFATTNGRLTEDNANLFWDDTNNRLGIGNAAPVVTLDITGVFALNPGTFFSAVDSTALAVYRGAGGGAVWYYLDPNTKVQYSSNTAATAIATSKPSPLISLRGNRWTGAVSTGIIADIQCIPNATTDLSTLAFGFDDNNSQMLNLTHGQQLGMGITAPTARVHIQAGTATASTAPLKFNSGTNLTTAEAGAVEYNGTNLFFTRSGTVRENVLVAIDNVAAPGTSIGVGIVNYYGSAATNFLGDPNRWLSVNILGATYRIPLYN